MSVSLDSNNYAPTLYLRPAELQGVQELPDGEKDLLSPIFCLKPWTTAKLLSTALDKIEQVYADREYFLDIDPFYSVGEIRRPAQEQFLELIDEGDNHQSWIDLFSQHPRAHPCLQVKHKKISAVKNQIEQFTNQEKRFLIRIELESGSDWANIIEACCETDHSNFGFVVDAGWSRDLLSRAAWASGVVRRIVDLRGDEIPIVTSGSSFPNSFAGYLMGESVAIRERGLFDQLRMSHNRARLVYGDWGSSRSPSEGGGGAEIPPRLELATTNAWEIFRANENIRTFPDLAKTLKSSKSYPRHLKIWATYVIDATEMNDVAGIKTHKRAAAARINMHLYRQIHFSDFNPAPDTDDLYEDI